MSRYKNFYYSSNKVIYLLPIVLFCLLSWGTTTTLVQRVVQFGQANSGDYAGIQASGGVVTTKQSATHRPVVTQQDSSDGETYTINLLVAKTTLKTDETVNMTAILLDQSGHPVVGELITFFGSLGTLAPDNAVTNSQGEVSAQYTAGHEPGHAKLQALVGSMNAAAVLEVADPGPVSTPQPPTAVPTTTAQETPVATPSQEATPVLATPQWQIYMPYIETK